MSNSSYGNSSRSNAHAPRPHAERQVAAIDPRVTGVSSRIAEIQRSAYAVEAELIGFDGIPQLNESPDDIVGLTDMVWRGAFVDGQLAGIVAWEISDECIEIDRLAVDQAFARRGLGRLLLRSVPNDRLIKVSTGSANAPALALYHDEGYDITGTFMVPGDVSMTQLARSGPGPA